MKTRLLALLMVSFLLAANSLQAKKVMLRLNLKKGTIYEMTTAMTNNIDQEMMGQKIKMDQKIDMAMSFQVLDILPNKNFLIEYSFLKMKLGMNMNGQQMTFDSESSDENDPASKILKVLSSVKLKIEMDPRGQTQKVEGLESFAKELAGNPQMAQAMQMFTDENSFKSYVGQTFNYFPEAEVEMGSKWTASFKLPALMNMETSMNFEVAAIEKSLVTLNVTSDVNLDSPIEQGGMKMNIKMTGTQNGSMIIDTTDGWLSSSDLAQKFDMKMKMKNPQTGEDMEIPMLMNSVATITVVRK